MNSEDLLDVDLMNRELEEAQQMLDSFIKNHAERMRQVREACDMPEKGE
jgi:DNA-nicking Smr family endonuclease